MEILVLDGKSYVKASKAAKELGYATDYVGQLCRSGQVDAHLIGRTWYVNQEELSTHRTEKKRMSRTKAREYAKRSIEEYREKTAKSTNTYRNIDIQYEHDEQPLLPVTKKLQIKSEPAKKEYAYKERVEGDEMEILNKGKHVVMSGDIRITDVTDGEIDRETTVLRPRIVHTQTPSSKPINNEVQDSPHEETVEEEQEETVSEESNQKISFIDRLKAVDDADVSPDGEMESAVIESVVIRPSFFACFVILVLITCISMSSLMVSKDISFTHLGGTTAIEQTAYTWSLEKLIERIGLKI
jgi:hypothetical protein